MVGLKVGSDGIIDRTVALTKPVKVCKNWQVEWVDYLTIQVSRFEKSLFLVEFIKIP